MEKLDPRSPLLDPLQPYADLLSKFPELHAEMQGRAVYFEAPSPEHAVLEARGYRVVYLFQLPRTATVEKQRYLEAKLQAIEEGTVKVGRDQLAALKLAAEITFGSKTKRAEVSEPVRTVDDLLSGLDWTSSRHTLRGNSTVQESKDVLQLLASDEEK